MDFLLSDPARWIFAAWFAFFGGAVGSFLNVVVYRLPAGLGIAWPGSHCPQCKHAIRAYDNVPVAAWLWLRGRCRDCGQPISARYPLVEAAMAGLFLLLLFVEVFHGGRNLPIRTAAAYATSQTVSFCLFHLFLLCTLLASALMTVDGHRPPWRLFAPLLIVGCLAPTIWPWLHPQPSVPQLAGSLWSGVIDSLLGLGASYCLGRAARWLGRRVAASGEARFQIWGEAMLIGVVLGWQAATVLTVLAVALEALSRFASARASWLGRCTAAVWLAPLALLWILNWASLANMFPAR